MKRITAKIGSISTQSAYSPPCSHDKLASIEVTIARDWIDYTQSGLTLVSLVLAGGAVWFARRSANDAAETAKAAQKTADIAAESAKLQRTEHEAFLEAQGRRPEVEAFLSILSLETQEDGSTTATVEWGALNTGSKAAEKALMVLLVGKTVKIERCNAEGANRRAINHVPQDHLVSINGDSVVSHSWNQDSDLRPNVQVIRHAVLTFESPGTYEIRVLIQHPEIEGGAVLTSESIRIPRVAVGAEPT